MLKKILMMVVLIINIAEANEYYRNYFYNVVKPQLGNNVMYYVREDMKFPEEWRPDPYGRPIDDVNYTWGKDFYYCTSQVQTKYEYLGCMWSKGHQNLE